jgi:hypothetical protein
MRESEAPEGVPSRELDRLVTEAELCLAEIDGLLAEIEGRARVIGPSAGRMCWRSEAAERFDERLMALRDRLTAAASAVAEGRHELERQLRLLRVLAEAARGTLWATN